jgi:hypothetical protein
MTQETVTVVWTGRRYLVVGNPLYNVVIVGEAIGDEPTEEGMDDENDQTES